MEVKDLPIEIQEKVAERWDPCYKDVHFSVREDLIVGFNWCDTPEGFSFWNGIDDGNFEVFYNKYPKKTPLNYKANPQSPEESRLIQEAWFEMGAKWSGVPEKYAREPGGTFHPFLYLRGALITCAMSRRYYDGEDLPIFTLNSPIEKEEPSIPFPKRGNYIGEDALEVYLKYFKPIGYENTSQEFLERNIRNRKSFRWEWVGGKRASSSLSSSYTTYTLSQIKSFIINNKNSNNEVSRRDSKPEPRREGPIVNIGDDGGYWGYDKGLCQIKREKAKEIELCHRSSADFVQYSGGA